ncbi:MAG TPA: LPS assembly lipoprotein LptE [Chitinophagales bacterium]|nr:LPS assembly lipoprotein LptE [Chitinophagales bacterium]
MACLLLALQACKVYSFTGANIPPDIHSFSVELFQNRANNGPASLPQTLTDKLKLKLQTEANLRQVSTDGDLQFRGTVTGFSYTSDAPVAGATSGLSRLTITIQIDFVNTKNDKDKWSESFSRYAQFSASQNVTSVEDQLVSDIANQLMDDIFQRALVKW